jgi:hypothetical protein
MVKISINHVVNVGMMEQNNKTSSSNANTDERKGNGIMINVAKNLLTDSKCSLRNRRVTYTVT